MNNRFMKKVDELYDFSYASKYGPDWIFSLFLILSAFSIVIYISIKDSTDETAENWNEVRCEPKNIIFAGMINPPKDGSMTAAEYTKKNFQGCLNDMASKTAYTTTKPYFNSLSALTGIFSNFGESINGIRKYLKSFRDKFSAIVEHVLGLIMNMLIEFQKLGVSIRDFFNKLLGIFTSAIMGLLGLYFALASGFKALFQLMLGLVVASTVLAIAAAISIFAWPITVVLLAFMGVLIYAMVQMARGFPPVMGGLSFPRAPRMPRIPKPRFPRWLCFDGKSKIIMNNNNDKCIKDIKVGDKLKNNNYVYAKFTLSGNHEKYNMFNLNDVIISGNHKVKYLGEWINVKDHNDSNLIEYKDSIIYNLVTFNKTITTDNNEFKDYDEMTDDEIERLSNLSNQNLFNNLGLFKNFTGGFHGDTILVKNNNEEVKIKDINVNDVLDGDVKVLGVVEIDAFELDVPIIRNINGVLVTCSNNVLYEDYLGKVMKVDTLNATRNEIKNLKKLYHLITDKNYFYIKFIKFYDYDYLIDFYLE